MPPASRLLALLLAVSMHCGWSLLSPALAGEREKPIELVVDGGKIMLRLDPDAFTLGREQILGWVSRSARAISVYYGRFPLPRAVLTIVPADGKGVKGGKAFGEGGGLIRVRLGRDSDRHDLAEDWVMVHEMIHLAFPRLEDRHDWLTEGLAVYVESVARLQAGDLDAGLVWRGFVEGMKHGMPRTGDKGMDFTPTWGRTYWGGAIFCLVADIEIHKRTAGAMSLRDALRGILESGGNFETHWPIEQALSAGDAATGTTVLMELYEAWRATPVDPDLDTLWDGLGVRVEGKTAVFDDKASLAWIRARIGRPPEDSQPPRPQ